MLDAHLERLVSLPELLELCLDSWILDLYNLLDGELGAFLVQGGDLRLVPALDLGDLRVHPLDLVLVLPLELERLGLGDLGAGLLDFELDVDLEIGVLVLQGRELRGLLGEPPLLLCLLGVESLGLGAEGPLHLSGLD